MPKLIRKNPLIAFFALAYLITWVLVLPLVLSAQGLFGIQVSPDWHFLGGLGPLVAAFIVTAVIGGRDGVRDLLWRMRRWPGDRLWQFLAVLSPVVIFGLSVVLVRLFGGSWPDFGRLALPQYAGVAWLGGQLLAVVAYGFGEEAGWRGFALPRLQRNRSALAATFILTLFWAVWHIPAFFYRFEFSAVQVVGFFIGLFAGAIWLTCLYNSTGGSILAVSLWHAAWNSVNQLALVVSASVLSLMSVFVMIAAVLIVLTWGPERFSPSGSRTRRPLSAQGSV